MVGGKLSWRISSNNWRKWKEKNPKHLLLFVIALPKVRSDFNSPLLSPFVIPSSFICLSVIWVWMCAYMINVLWINPCPCVCVSKREFCSIFNKSTATLNRWVTMDLTAVLNKVLQGIKSLTPIDYF